RLTGLERQKILDELAALKKEIERLRTILGSRRLLIEIVVHELREIEQKYGNARRTTIVDDPGEIRIEDLIADEDMAITVSNTGYINGTWLDSSYHQHRVHQAAGAPRGLGAAARRQAQARNARARGGFRQPHLRGLAARLHHDL